MDKNRCFTGSYFSSVALDYCLLTLRATHVARHSRYPYRASLPGNCRNSVSAVGRVVQASLREFI